MTPSLKLEPRVSQGLTARLRLAVRLLQLSSLDYEQELHEIAAKNPFLDLETPIEAPLATPPDSWSAAAQDDPPENESTASDAEVASAPLEREADFDPWLQNANGVRDGARDGGGSMLDLMVDEIDIRAHLRSQARTLRLSLRDQTLVHAIVESLDDDGYLRTALDEIALVVGGKPPADATEMSTALRLVQSLEPAGVAARSVGECLRLQLGPAAAEGDLLAPAIIDQHLEKLARRDTAAIARALGQPLGAVERACAMIRRLDPHPARRFDCRRVHYVVPDVVVRKTRGRWDVQLNAAAVPNLQLNRTVCELFQRQRPAANHELAGHLQEARWAVRNIEQRFSTILAVSRSILKRQYGYFEHGPLAMKPLALAEIAAEVGVHESTVCRVTNNKYMATPAGVIELKSFFSRPMALASGGAASGVAIRELVREMIDDESGAAALSDGEIARRLGRQGVKITRRTVTKYRGMLQLPAAEQRQRARSDAAAIAAAGARRSSGEPAHV